MLKHPLVGLAVASCLAIGARPAAATPYESGGKVHDHFGAYTEHVPITVPAFHGIEPRLTLAYHSSNGNGIVGVGWSLRGPSVIEMHGDASTTSAQLRFTLDGEPLIPCDRQTDRTVGATPTFNSPSCEPGAVTAGTAGYSTLSESYLKIQQSVPVADDPFNTWTVWQKNGTQAIYTQSDTWAWVSTHVKYVLTSVTDTSGNTVTYHWDMRKDGHAFTKLASITYNGTVIKLHYTARVLDETFAGGREGLDTMDRQLATIDVCVNPTATDTTPCGFAGAADPHRARAYQLGYRTSLTTSRPLLTKVQMFGTDAVLGADGVVTAGTAAPPLTIGWRDPAPTTSTIAIAGIVDFNWGVPGTEAFVDWNGDGHLDYCRGRGGSPPAGRDLVCAFGDGAWGLQSGPEMWVGDVANWGSSSDARSYADWDGDGKPDLCRTIGNNLACDFSNGVGMDVGFSLALSVGLPGQNWFTDWNGDGKVDLCRLVGLDMWCAFGLDRLGFDDRKVGSLTPSTEGNVNTWGIADWNGDGRSDFCRVHRSLGQDLIRCLIAGFDPFDRTNRTVVAKDVSMGALPAIGNVIGAAGFLQWVDVNGDGKSDYCRGVGAGSIRCAISNGIGSPFATGFQDVEWATGANDTIAAYPSRKWGDLNGDGKLDVCSSNGIPYPNAPISNKTCTVSDGLTSHTVIANLPISGYEASYDRHWMIDWNGDGRSEYCLTTGSQGGVGSTLTCIRRNAAGPTMTDLATSFDNGIGGTTAVSYVPSSAWAASTTPPNNSPPIVATVSQTVTDDGAGTVATTSYRYAGGRHDAFTGRFLGFAWARVSGPCLTAEGAACPYTDTTYNLDPRWPTRPSGVYRYGGSPSVLLHSTVYDYRNTTTTPHRADPMQETITAYHGAAYNVTQVVRTYDRYGNVTRVLDLGLVADGITPFHDGDDRVVETTYVVNPSAYIVDRPATIVGRDGLAFGADQLTAVRYVYDTNADHTQAPTLGRVTRTETWLDTEDRFLRTTNPYDTAYDTPGNVVSETDALNHQTSYQLDPVYQLYPITTTTPPTGTALAPQSVATTWDARCGKKLTETQVQNGTVTTYTYDALCRKIRTDWAGGGFEKIAYHDTAPRYHEVAVPGPAGDLWTRTTVDGLGRTREVRRRGPGANDIIAAAYRYDVRGNLVSSQTPSYSGDVSHATTYGYDVLDRQIRMTLPDGGVRTTAYELRKAIVTDELGHQQLSQTDVRGRTTWTCTLQNNSCLGDNVYYAYDARGHLARMQQLGQHNTQWSYWTFTHDSLGRRVALSDPDAGARRYTYDAVGNLTDEVDAKGARTHYTYDALRRMTSKTLDYCASSGRLRCNFVIPQPTVVTWGYDEWHPGFTVNVGRLTSMTDPSGAATYDYDVAGNLRTGTRIVDGIYYTFLKRHDLGGRLLATTYPDFSTVGTVAAPLGYDAAGRLQSIPGIISAATYDARGALTSYAGANGTWTTFDTATHPRGLLQGQVTRGPMRVSPDGRMSLGTYAKAWTNSANQGYEHFTVPGGALVVGQRLRLSTCGDAVGGLTGASGAGNTYLRLFDPSGNEVAENDDASPAGPCGTLSTIDFTIPTGGAGVYTLRAGCFGATACRATVAAQVKSAPLGNVAFARPATQSSCTASGACWGGVASRVVDGNTDGNWAAGSVNHTNNVNDVTPPAQSWWQVDLQATRLIERIEVWNRTDCSGGCFPGGVPNEPARLTNFQIMTSVDGATWTTHTHAGQAGTPSTFAWSSLGRYVRIQLVGTNYLHMAEVRVFASTPVQKLSQPVLHNVYFARDQEGRISSITSNRPDESWNYEYSPNGLHQLTAAFNRYDRTLHSFGYEDNGNLTSGPSGAAIYPTGPDPAHPHAIQSDDEHVYAYDANGQMTEAWPGLAFTWDSGGRLASVNGQTFYSYDAEGYRLKQIENGVTTVYLGDDYEVTNGVATKYVSLGGKLVARQTGTNSPIWLYTNHQGSVVLGVDAGGAEVVSASYTPYGDPIVSNDPDGRGYTGQRRDDHGLLYLHARMAMPALGRFLSPDPTIPTHRGVGLNRYAYAQNDPINRTDIDGLGFWEDAGARFSGLTKGLSTVPIIGGALALPLATLDAGFKGDDEKALKAVGTQAVIAAAIAVSVVTYGYGAPAAATFAIGVASSFASAFTISMINNGNVEAALGAGAESAFKTAIFQTLALFGTQFILPALKGESAADVARAAVVKDANAEAGYSPPIKATFFGGKTCELTVHAGRPISFVAGPLGGMIRTVAAGKASGMMGGGVTAIELSRGQAIGTSTMPRLSSATGTLYGYGYDQAQSPPP